MPLFRLVEGFAEIECSLFTAVMSRFRRLIESRDASLRTEEFTPCSTSIVVIEAVSSLKLLNSSCGLDIIFLARL